MARNIPNQCKLTAFTSVKVPKVKDIFRRMGYRKTSQSESGLVADFSRNPLESFDGENRRMFQHYYEKYREMVESEESEEEKKDDSPSIEDKESVMVQ